jgi:hypothetical protein
MSPVVALMETLAAEAAIAMRGARKKEVFILAEMFVYRLRYKQVVSEVVAIPS